MFGAGGERPLEASARSVWICSEKGIWQTGDEFCMVRRGRVMITGAPREDPKNRRADARVPRLMMLVDGARAGREDGVSDCARVS